MRSMHHTSRQRTATEDGAHLRANMCRPEVVHHMYAHTAHWAAMPLVCLQALRSVLAYEERPAQPIQVQVSRPQAAAAEPGAAAGQQQQRQQEQHEATFDHLMEAYTNFCFLMAVARPSMAAVANTAADAMLQLQRELEARADPFEPTAGVAR